MENKQTAVEWLIDKIVQDQLYKAMSQKEWVDIFEEAKVMEYKQNMNSIQEGMDIQKKYSSKPSFRERNGLIDPHPTEISDEEWVGCDGCTETDEYFWKKGFQAGYLRAKPEEISDEEIEKFVKSNNPYPLTKQGSVDWEHGFVTAIEWYKEQLKKK